MMPVFRPHSSADTERIEFSKKLINLMRDHNMNQADLARRAGLTRDAVSTYVRARSMPEPANMAKLAAALGVESTYFQLDANRLPERMPAVQPYERPRTDRLPNYDAPPSAAAEGEGAEDYLNITVTEGGKKAVVRLVKTMDAKRLNDLLAFFAQPEE